MKYDDTDSFDLPYNIGDYAALKVISLQEIGAFLDWGSSKDLFLPFSEQTRPLKVGYEVFVYIYNDKLQRPCASMRWEKSLNKIPAQFKTNQEVPIIIAAKTDIGYKAIINKTHVGVIYANEVFKQISIGEHCNAYIKKIRDDGKIDLSLQQLGHHSAVDISEQIIKKLNENNGYLPIDDKTSPELIYELFGVSKKKYKMALGHLYKNQKITIHEDGIRINTVAKQTKP